MYLDPLDSPNLLRKISENTVIDGFGNHYELLPKEPPNGPGGFWAMLLSGIGLILVLL